jgi:hypothetical protein
MSDIIQINSTATLEVQAKEEDGVTALNLSDIATPDADNLKIICNGPAGEIVVYDGAGTGGAPPVVFSTEGPNGDQTDGIFRVVTSPISPGNIGIEGPWMYQGYAKTDSGQEYWSPKFNFEAEDNLPEV